LEFEDTDYQNQLNVVQFASFILKLQMEEVLFLINLKPACGLWCKL